MMERKLFKFILIIIRAVFLLYPTRQMEMVVENAILKKENEILKRKKKDRIKFRFFDRLFYVVMCKLSEKAKGCVTLIKPDTVLKWLRNLIKEFWTFPYINQELVDHRFLK